MRPRFSLESHVQSGEAALLRGASPLKQDPLGKVSQLQVQAPAEENLHHRRQEAAHRGVQADDAVSTSGDEAVFRGVSVVSSSITATFRVVVLSLKIKESLSKMPKNYSLDDLFEWC